MYKEQLQQQQRDRSPSTNANSRVSSTTTNINTNNNNNQNNNNNNNSNNKNHTTTATDTIPLIQSELQSLLEKIPLSLIYNKRFAGRRTLLHWIAMGIFGLSYSQSIVSQLSSQFPVSFRNSLKWVDSVGCTPLHLALLYGEEDLFELILRKYYIGAAGDQLVSQPIATYSDGKRAKETRIQAVVGYSPIHLASLSSGK